MESLQSYRIFLSVADCASFSEAARQLGLSLPKVSRAIAELEAGLGLQLLKRTTRRVDLTPAGASFAERIRPAVSSLLEAIENQKSSNEITGFNEVRVACEPAVAEVLALPSVPGFAARYPQARLRIDVWDRPVSPENEGYDLVITVQGGSAEPGTVIGRLELVLVASPSYIALHKRPYAAADVAQHKLLIWSGLQSWALRGHDPFTPQASVFSNNISLIKKCCVAASGIAMLPLAFVREELESQSLLQLLDGFEPKPLSIVARWGAQQKPLCGAQAFMDHLAGEVRRLRL